MAESVDLRSVRSLVVRRQKDGGQKEGCTGERHLLFGPTGADGPNQLRYRTLLQFSLGAGAAHWASIASIIKIEFGFRTYTSLPAGFGAEHSVGKTPTLWFDRLTSGFNAPDKPNPGGAEDTWIGADYAWPTVANTPKKAVFPINPLTGNPQDQVFVWMDVTAQVRPLVPPSIMVIGIGKGQGTTHTNHGFVIRCGGDESKTAWRGVGYSGDARVASNNEPLLRITYNPKNLPPDAPVLLAPPVSGVSFSQSFEGQHTDPDFDPMDAREIKVWKKGVYTGTPPFYLTGDGAKASSTETNTGRFVVPISLAGTALKYNVDYEWQARTKANVGVFGAWSAVRALKIDSTPPSVVATNLGSIPDLASVHFGGTYEDAPENNPLSQFRIRMQPTTGLDWADFDKDVWDTGEIDAHADEITAKKISRLYSGRPIVAGNYTYSIEVMDSTLAWSLARSVDAFVLLNDYELDPGAPTIDTTQMNRIAPARIALYKMGTNRGPGALLGYIDDPTDLGATRYLNGGGEMFFSLPALHPYCEIIEPHQVHYQVQQYYGDRYRAIFAGLITDFDADADTVTFYGTDYLGLLQTAVDERYNPKNTEQAASGTGTGGSKYINQNIDAVIKDQLAHHRTRPNSPVAFISTAPPTRFSTLVEKVTIYSTYAEALPFIVGLIDSHKQGTGSQIRFYDRALTDDYKTFEWALVDGWGRDRPSIRLEYGGLLNDFRVIALGDFGTQVLAVGQKRGEVKVYRAKGKILLDETKWGRRVQTRFYQDIVDQNDLQRRADEATADLSKVGKRMALAIRADSLQPFDGWDVGDRIAIDIKRGVVDTSRYGSGGMWVILGVEWRYSPDGHSDLVLSISPKQTASGASPDLIGSIYPGVPIEFQTGHGVPSSQGVPPTATPAPGTMASIEPLVYPLDTDPIVAATYQDLNSGCIYELDEELFEPPGDPGENPNPDFNTYHEVYCPSDTGGGGDGAVDTEPPPVPVFKPAWWSEGLDPAVDDPDLVAISELVVQDDGTTLTGLFANVGYDSPPLNGDGSPLGDLSEFMLEATRYQSSDLSPDWTMAQTRIVASADATGSDTIVVHVPVTSATPYSLRVAAIDVSGNRSGWSPVIEVMSSEDDVAPPRPKNIVVQSGMNTAGVRWDPILASDFAYTEVQFRTAYFAGAVAIDEDLEADPPIESQPAIPERLAGEWVPIRTAATLVVITGLPNGNERDPKAIDIRLRSVDTSNNTYHATGGLDPEGNPEYDDVKATDPEVGWVDADQATPTALPADALIWTEAIIEDLFAGEINATWITTGTLRVGNAPPLTPEEKEEAEDGPTRIEVYDADGNLVGRWGVEGIEVMDPANDDYKLVIRDSGLSIWNDVTKKDPVTGESLAWESVRLTPQGIDAASITFGSMRGGHNLVVNSSFEMGDFAVVTTKTSEWDTNTHWNAAGSRQIADTNITVNASTLTMASVT